MVADRLAGSAEARLFIRGARVGVSLSEPSLRGSVRAAATERLLKTPWEARLGPGEWREMGETEGLLV